MPRGPSRRILSLLVATRFAAALAAALAMAQGCGPSAEPRPSASPPPAEPDAAPVVIPPFRGGDVGDPNGPASHPQEKQEKKPRLERAANASPLELRVVLPGGEAIRGEGVHARLVLANVSDAPVPLFSAAEDLARRAEILVQRAGETTSVGAPLPMFEPKGGGRTEPLAPGARVIADVNLLSALEDTRSYLEGKVRFTVEYRGSEDLGEAGSSAWNANPENRVVSRLADLDVVLPDWLQGLSADTAAFGAVRDAALLWQSGAPDADRHTQAVASRGEAGWGCLLLLTRGLASRVEENVTVARNALSLLRLGGDAALAAARKAQPGSDPALLMAIAVLEEDRLAREETAPAGPVARGVRDVSAGAQDGTWFEIALHGTSRLEPVSYLLDRNGVFTVTRGEGDAAKSASRELPTDQLAELKTALVASRMSAWRRLRTWRTEKEGFVTVRLGRGDDLLLALLLHEDEALHANPLVADLVQTFASASADLQPKQP